MSAHATNDFYPVFSQKDGELLKAQCATFKGITWHEMEYKIHGTIFN